MRCNDVRDQLSSFLDEMVESEKAELISQHLDKCSQCRQEFRRLSELRQRLSSLPKINPPEYLRHLVELRINAESETWIERLRLAWEYRWSKIRTTERMWYMTRIAGTAMTFLLFFMISASINPMVVELNAARPGNIKPIMNDLYYLNFGENASHITSDDNLTVVMAVDRSGTPKIQSIIEYPTDSSLLADLSSMITSARCRPALHKGRAVESHMVLSFSRIAVYE